MSRQILNHLYGAGSRFSYVRLAFNYYALKEYYGDSLKTLKGVQPYVEDINRIVMKFIIENEPDCEKIIPSLDRLRNQLIQNMEVLTAYTDHFLIYEYVLNRMEYKLKDEDTYDMEDDLQLEKRVADYILEIKDNVVINSRIQEIVGQLPIRLTKGKFFELLRDGLSIYEGGERKNLDDLVYMLKTGCSLMEPEDMESAYQDIWDNLDCLESGNYKDIKGEDFARLSEVMEKSCEKINEFSGLYILLQEIVNDVYVILLTKDYALKEQNEFETCIRVIEASIRGVCGGEQEADDNTVIDWLVMLEGRQEKHYEKYSSWEMKAFGADPESRDEVWNKISLLLSGSHFVDIHKIDNKSEMVDREYMNEVLQDLVSEFEKRFSQCSKPVVRSIMAKTLSSLPVFLNSMDEILLYVKGSLEGCHESYEKAAFSDLLYQLTEM